MQNTLYVVVPCYNEQEVLPETARRLRDKLQYLMNRGRISRKSRILFVNDGSRDGTWEIIERLHIGNHLFSGLNLSRNRGHQNALLAGLMYAKDRADMAISMDADLQDDIDAVDEMVDKYLEGVDIVYGVRSSRERDTFFKRTTAEAFYRLMNALGAETVFNHADYRLLSRRALEGLSQFREVNLFLRGIVPMIGYRTDVVSLCTGGHHLPVGEAPAPHHRAGIFRLSRLSVYDSLQHHPLGHGQHRHGLGQPILLGVAHWRAHFALSGGNWRICGQAIHGGQRPSPLPCPGCGGRTRLSLS